MITPIDVSPWSPVNLTGNSAIVWTTAGAYVVGATKASHVQAIYHSTDHGLTWAVAGQITAPAGSVNPVVVLDPDGTTLHIVTSRPNVGNAALWDIVKYAFNTTNNTLSAAVPLVQGSRVVSSYDVVPTGSGNSLVVATSFQAATPSGHPTSYVLWAFEVTAAGVVTPTILQVSPWQTGPTIAGLSLLDPGDGLPIELYYAQAPRLFNFKDTTMSLNVQFRSAAGTWTPPGATPLTTYMARMVDNKLAVLVTPDGSRVLAQTFFSQDRIYGLQSSIIYGSLPAPVNGIDGSWQFTTMWATPGFSFKEPVLETNGSQVFMAYLVCPYEGSRYSNLGNPVIGVLTLPSLYPAPLAGGFQRQSYKWLRGSRSVIPIEAGYALIGISGADDASGTGSGWYVSGHILPPQVVISPASATVVRGVPQVLSAAQTIDLDSLNLQYTWTLNSSDLVNITLTPSADGTTAILLVSDNIGPAAATFSVVLTVTDLTDPTIPGTTLNALMTLGFIPEVTVTLPPDRAIDRNSETFLTATVTNPTGTALTYLWQQVSGDPVDLGDTTGLTVSVKDFRMDAGGETVVLRFSAMDNINPPVSATINLAVAPMANTTDSTILDRVHFCRSYLTVNDAPATISQRNAPGSWPAATLMELFSDFWTIKAAVTPTGRSRISYISNLSCMTLGPPSDNPQPYFKRVYPPAGNYLVDATYDELEHTYLLASGAGKSYVLRYTSPGVAGVSDWPDDIIDLSVLTTATFNSISVLLLLNGLRVIILTGTQGLLLLQVNEATFVPSDAFPIDASTGLLPYADVQWIRTSNVTSLRSGTLLVGVVAPDGSPTEVWLDLASRRQLQLWNNNNFPSSLVTTGELLSVQTAASTAIEEELAWVSSTWVSDTWTYVG